MDSLFHSSCLPFGLFRFLDIFRFLDYYVYRSYDTTPAQLTQLLRGIIKPLHHAGEIDKSGISTEKSLA